MALRRAGRLVLCATALVAVGLGLGATGPAYVGATHISRGRGCERVIALTFDDGPNPPYTGQIADLLREEGVPATFFVEGEAAAAHPEDVIYLRDAGMAIGSHSYSHSEALATITPVELRSDLESADSVLRGILGDSPRLFRPPFGRASAAMLDELRRDGYVSVGWDIDSDDWQERDPARIAANVLSQAHPGAIVLLHDGGLSGGNADRGETAAALPSIIDGLMDSGYRFVTVPEILDPKVCSASLR